MNKYFEICEKKVRLRDGSVHSVTGKPEAYAVSPKISEQDELTASASMRKFRPSAGLWLPEGLCRQKRSGDDLNFRRLPFVSIYSIRNGGSTCFRYCFFGIPGSRASWSFKRPEDYLVFLAVSGKENRADLVGWEKGLRLTLSSNCAGKRKMQDVALICGAGKDPYAVTEEAVKWALKLSERT